MVLIFDFESRLSDNCQAGGYVAEEGNCLGYYSYTRHGRALPCVK